MIEYILSESAGYPCLEVVRHTKEGHYPAFREAEFDSFSLVELVQFILINAIVMTFEVMTAKTPIQYGQ